MKRPINDVLNGVFSVLQENNIQVNQNSVEYVVSAMSQWLEENPRGHEFMAYLLQLDHAPGQHDKDYWLTDGFGRLTDKIKPESIVFLRGAVSNGEMIPIRQLQINDKEIIYCEGCGGGTVCTEENYDRETQDQLALCTYCMTMSGDPNTARNISLECSKCTYAKCQWNPQHQRYAMSGS